MRAASSSSNPSFVVDVVEEYPYPSHIISTPNLVTVKLSGRDTYKAWKIQMSCLLKSHNMLGFINSKFVSPDHGNRKRKVGDMEECVRSDELVKSWILGSLSKKTTMDVIDRLTSKLPNQDFTAKDAWDELRCIYGPVVIQQAPDKEEIMATEADLIAEGSSVPRDAGESKENEKTNEEKKVLDLRAKLLQKLYDYTVSGKWASVNYLLSEEGLKVTDKITNNGNTALHVAVSTNKNHELLEKMLATIAADYPLVELVNSDGSTLLHIAAMVGNIKAVEILMTRNPNMLITDDKESHSPLAVALSNMRKETSECLMKHIESHKEKLTRFYGESGEELLVLAVSSKDYDLALRLSWHCKDFISDAVLTAVAQNFPPELNIWERQGALSVSSEFNVQDRSQVIIFSSEIAPWVMERQEGYFDIRYCFHSTISKLVAPFSRERVQTHDDFIIFVVNFCWFITTSIDSSSHHRFYTNPIFEATKQNAFEVVKIFLDCFPSAIWSVNKDGHNIIQYAVINRSEKVYNLILQMSEHRNTYLTIKDSNGNNLLHLAAKLAPPNKLNIISGAALQIQHELQWFKEVESFVSPLHITQLNSLHETPQMLFTKEHKELVIEGEKWMKTTAESYTITAALITTMVFAAAITVPGGNNQDTGIPIFTNNIAFTIFAISDAISLFTSVTSLLMFLSILTTRYAEQDFLFKLPRKLIIGLTTLFISTTSMIITFGATLFIVFGQNNSMVLISIVGLTCLPITSFVTMQFPLVIDLISATYGRSIFGKKEITISRKYFVDEVPKTHA